MTQRRALGDLDFDSAFDDPDNGWFGHVPAVDPISSRDHEDLPEPPPDEHALDGTEDTDRWPVLTLDTKPPAHLQEERDHEERVAYVADPGPAAEPSARRWSDDPLPAASPSWESKLSNSGAWDFKVAASGPRGYRPKFVVAAMIVAGLVVAGVVLFLRSPGPAEGESPVVAPSQQTAQPTSTSAAPSPSTPSQAPLPPGLPPPPPPTAEELRPPVVTRDYTPRRQNAPDDSDKPEIGVTRAPATRTQMSATPPPPRAPDRNSSTPGDGPKRNGFGF